jgi:hypothetical protein
VAKRSNSLKSGADCQISTEDVLITNERRLFGLTLG